MNTWWVRIEPARGTDGARLTLELTRRSTVVGDGSVGVSVGLGAVTVMPATEGRSALAENAISSVPSVTGTSNVRDVAVIGGPHDEMGEEVIAVVQPLDMADAGDDLRDELTAYAREKLSGIKIPRRIDFREELPRHDTGKLYKRLLRDEYWAKQDKPTT